MSAMIKYRVHEVGKDFGRTSKEITQILTDYATTPKNHMQVLEDDELSVIFEYLTQHNQIESLEEVFKETYHPPVQEKAAPGFPPVLRSAQESPSFKKRAVLSKTVYPRGRGCICQILCAFKGDPDDPPFILCSPGSWGGGF